MTTDPKSIRRERAMLLVFREDVLDLLRQCRSEVRGAEHGLARQDDAVSRALILPSQEKPTVETCARARTEAARILRETADALAEFRMKLEDAGAEMRLVADELENDA